MNITFGILKELTASMQKRNEDRLVDYLNSFEGNNVFDKFKNILISWENDVTYVLNVRLNGVPTNIQLSYILSEFPQVLDSELTMKDDDIELVLGIPEKFTASSELIPIYDIIKQIKISGVFINLTNLSIHDKNTIINSLPPKIYNMIFTKISNDSSKVVTFNNPMLKNFRFNFLTNEPYVFLKHLFSNYSEDYFRDVIFHLSKKIDGKLLMDSTPLDIKYYIEKFSSEVDPQKIG